MYSNKVTGMEPKQHDTYKDIAKRLARYRINLDNFIEHKEDLTVYESTLDGVHFITRKPGTKMMLAPVRAAFEYARKPDGLPAFRQGNDEEGRHWALDASMANTKGIGYREIWDPVLTDKGMRLDAMKAERHRLGVPELDAPFSDHFGKRMDSIDVSSLHVAIHGDYCSIHVDKAGFTMRALPGFNTDVSVTAESFPHTLVELIWMDKIKVPEWLELVVPGTQYSRMGISWRPIQSDKMNISMSFTCGRKCKSDYSGTVSMFGSHDIGGGGR